MNQNWKIYFMKMVYLVSSKSKDPSTKVGAVITSKDHQVLSTGYNGICRGVLDPYDVPDNKELQCRCERPTKYEFYEHAERNAIYHAARHGVCIKDSIMYTQLLPCSNCARGIIQSGISKIVLHKQLGDNMDADDRWNPTHKISVSKEMFDEAGIEIDYLDSVLGVKHLCREKIHEV